MSHAEAIHPPECSIEHLLAAHRLNRCAHDRRDGRHVRIDARLRRRAEQVAFGHDSGRMRTIADDEERADPMLGHHAGGLAQRSVGPDGLRGSRHHLVEPAPVQETVDAGEGRRRCRIGGVSGHRVPSRLHFAVDEVCALGGECLGLAEGAHVRLAKPRHERGEDSGRSERVAERVVARLDGDAEPIRERFEPEIDEPSIQRPGQVRHVERGGVAPGTPARAASWRSTARSKRMFWPTTTRPSSSSRSGSNSSARRGALATSVSLSPWMRVERAGMGTPGSTRVSMRGVLRTLDPCIATAPIWTIRSFATSRPVVSRSNATAGSAASAVWYGGRWVPGINLRNLRTIAVPHHITMAIRLANP